MRVKRLLVLSALAAAFVVPSARADATSSPVLVYVDNVSSAVTQAELEADLPAFQLAVSRDLQRFWGVDAVLTANPSDRPAAQMVVSLEDDATCLGCLGEHDVVKGVPTAFVYAHTSALFNEAWSLVFTHELFEMLVDPWLNRFSLWNKRSWLVEDADPVESGFYAYSINGVVISDFITPAWYGSIEGKLAGPFDFTGGLKRAGQIGRHGYASYLNSGGWHQAIG